MRAIRAQERSALQIFR